MSRKNKLLIGLGFNLLRCGRRVRAIGFHLAKFEFLPECMSGTSNIKKLIKFNMIDIIRLIVQHTQVSHFLNIQNLR